MQLSSAIDFSKLDNSMDKASASVRVQLSYLLELLKNSLTALTEHPWQWH
jgi:hypothetical protein